MKTRLQGFIFGVVFSIIVFAGFNIFAESIDVVFNAVNIKISGNQEASIDDNYSLKNGEQVPFSISYKGTTYLPMRKLVELLNKDVFWDEETKTINVNDKGNSINTTGSQIQEKQMNNKFKLFAFEGKDYVSLFDLSNQYNNGFGFGYDDDTKKVTFTFNPDIYGDTNKTKTIINDIPTKVIEGRSYVEYSYFTDKLLNLLEQKRSKPSTLSSNIKLVYKVDNDTCIIPCDLLSKDKDNNYYLSCESINTILSIKDNNYIVSESNSNPFIKGIINSKSKYYEINKKYINARYYYLEGQIRFGDKVYQINTDNANSKGFAWECQDSVVLPITDVLTSFGVKVTTSIDNDNNFIIITLN